MKPSFDLFVYIYLTDPKFRRKFEKDRVKAVKGLGYKMTPELRKALKNLDLEELQNLAGCMGERAAFC
jgi:hypothetical protein